jgi:hypothetical protein
MLTVINGPTIAAGESLSNAVDCTAGALVRITMPPEWTAAPITFQFSTDGLFFNEMCTLEGRAVTIEDMWPGSGVIVPEHVGRAIAHIKFRSGTAGNPIPQEEERWFAVAIIDSGDASPPPPLRSAKKKAPAKKKAAKKKR